VTRRLKITAADLAELVASEHAAGTQLVAPVKTTGGAIVYRRIERWEDAALEGPIPRDPLKRFFLPPTEPLFSWSRDGAAVFMDQLAGEFARLIVLGARPCDAAALPILDRVMGWDFVDELWFGRRSAATVITVACAAVDSSCFCTAVGLAPDASAGSDLLLTSVDGDYLGDVVTASGERLVADHEHRFSEAATTDRPAAPHESSTEAVGWSMASVRGFLQDHFDDSIWRELALACHGCGACAAVCPTCHCFDIVDEPEGVTTGTRRRNWDTCQSAGFTVHASGHNPRADQSARLRQRLMHKFLYYPRRFDQILCTGCGRCVRACPAGIDLPEILELFERRVASPGPPATGIP
jgi:ferredoxin